MLVYTRKGLLNILGANDVTDLDGSDEVIVERDVNFQRCGIESKIIVQGAPSGRAHPRSAQAIQKALHLALQWNARVHFCGCLHSRATSDVSSIVCAL